MRTIKLSVVSCLVDLFYKGVEMAKSYTLIINILETRIEHIPLSNCLDQFLVTFIIVYIKHDI